MLCDPVAGDLLKDSVKDIGRNVELLIVSIGAYKALTTARYSRNYAKAFSGRYEQIDKVEDLPRVVQSVSSYGYGYGY